jgi:hypothetical protein
MTKLNADRNLVPALVLLAIAALLAVLSILLFGGWNRVSENLPAFMAWLLLAAAGFYTALVVATIAIRALLSLGSPK